MDEVTFTLPRSGITLRGHSTGGTGMPVLCLHGWLDNCASFAPLMRRLPQLNLIAIDLPGHGLSDPGPGVVNDLLSYAACVLELAHSQGWQRFGLVGHSMGGVVSAITAGLHPDKVARLALVDIIGLFTSTPQQTPVRLAGYLDAYLREAPADTYPTREQAVRIRAQLGDMSIETAELLSERDLAAVDGGYAWRTDQRLKYPFPLFLGEEHMRALLGRITAPVLRVTAKRPSPKPSLCLGMDEVLRAARLVTLPGGHHLHMENADQVASEVGRFLNGL